MKAIALIFFVLGMRCLAQPFTNGTTLVTLNVDGVGSYEGRYSIHSEFRGDLPVIWDVTMALIPNGASRILRTSSDRIDFEQGTEIGVSSKIYSIELPNPPKPSIFVYNLALLNYRAIQNPVWSYISLNGSTFEDRGEVILGYRFALLDGNHFGWLRFKRAVVDKTTPFDLQEVEVHPLPNEGINAGEMAKLPQIISTLLGGNVEFRWDGRWGQLVLETSTNLLIETLWEKTGEGTGGPVTVTVQDDMRYFRLRRP